MSLKTCSSLVVLLILAAVPVATAQPTISSITPTTIAAGTATFTLDVFGTGFVDDNPIFQGSSVRWNGTTSLSTTYVSPLHLRATVGYSLIASQGTAQVTVYNGTFTTNPGTSNARTCTIGAPLSVGISHINPTSVVAGSGGLTLFVYGNGFRQGGGIPYIPPSVVTWNGSPLTTNYVVVSVLSNPYLRASVPASLTACGGTAQIRVENPSPIFPFGSTSYSNIVTFTISPAASSPSISSISPASAVAGGPSFTMTVTGCNFAISYTNIGPVNIANYPFVLLDGATLTTAWVSSTQLTAAVPASALAAARTAQVQVRNMLSTFSFADSPPVSFGILAPAIASLTPAQLPPMGPASLPVQLVIAGSRFLPGATIHADGTPLLTTYVSASELRAQVSPALVQTQRPGGIAINVANATEAVSNTMPLVVGGGANQGTLRRQPLAPAPGQAFAAVIEGGAANALFSFYVDLENPSPIVSFPDPAADLVLSVYPASSGALFFPVIEGIGIYGTASGATLGTDGSITLPGLVLPNPPAGITFTSQAIYLDPAAPYGFRLTWARFPDTL